MVEIKRKNLVSVVLTLFVLTMLILAGPTSAVKLKMEVDNAQAEAGDMVTFTAQMDIENNERVPVQFFNVTIRRNSTGDAVSNCVFGPNGVPKIGECGPDFVDITPINTGFDYQNASGYGYGYGFNENQSGYVNTSFGFGYGYGHESGYGLPINSEFKYEIEWQTPNVASDETFTVSLEAVSKNTDNGKSFVYELEDELDIEVLSKKPTYTNLKVRLPMEYNETNNYWFNITLESTAGIDTAKLFLDGDGYDMGLPVSGDSNNGLWSYNQTNLSQGNYTFYFWANDTNGKTWTSLNSTFTVRELIETESIINDTNYEVPVNVTNVIAEVLGNVTVPATVTSRVTVDLSNNIANGEFTTEKPIVLKRNATTTSYKVEIKTGTKISADVAWDGKLMIPEVEENVVVPTGKQGSVDLAIKMGSDDYEISFDKPVKVILPDQANKSAGWKRGNSAVTEITTTCDNVTAPTNISATSSPKICKINDGDDLIIWTYHFTTFVAGDWEDEPSSSGGSSSSSRTYSFGTLGEGETKSETLSLRDKIEFGYQNGERHSLKVENIDHSNKKIRVTIQSDPIELDMIEGEVYSVDTDANGADDLETWFEFTSTTRVKVYVQPIEEVFDTPTEETPVDEPVDTTTPTQDDTTTPTQDDTTTPTQDDTQSSQDSVNNNQQQDNTQTQADSTTESTTTADEEDAGSKWWLWLLIVLVVGAIGFVIFQESKKKKE